MAQIFSRSADMWFRLALFGVGGGALLIFVVGLVLARSDYSTGQNWRIEQPVPFSHRHHAGELGIDCRYCHSSVEQAAAASFPPTHTCMSCHSQVWTGAPMLEPVRRSLTENEPLRWNWVNKLPDYVYLHHGVHVQAGVGCAECHGRVDRMPLMRRENSFQMQWCLECHRDPAPRLRPRRFVTDMDWQPEGDRRALGERLMQKHGIAGTSLTHCYTCHR
ncbi:cytochrome c3 family protein [Stutzerimonas balearica]|uniref:cytochrome c3 family protein n=1 Tax=Stutzerimonas balearica TaxID=74829 RepID=UPI0028AC4AD0|nr:cytochrome c3 family protein [Stutzerimonas balearica]